MCPSSYKKVKAVCILVVSSGIIVAIAVAAPNMWLAWKSSKAESIVVQLGLHAGDPTEYFVLDSELATQFKSALRRHSRAVPFPTVASAAPLAVFYFDADRECIYCVRLLGRLLSNQGGAELVKLARSGTAVTELEADEMITGEYGIATRRLRD